MLRKILVIILCCICCALLIPLTGCTNKPIDNSDSNDNSDSSSLSLSMMIYVDEETGVNYIRYSNGTAGGITPRYNADGTLYVEDN